MSETNSPDEELIKHIESQLICFNADSSQDGGAHCDIQISAEAVHFSVGHVVKGRLRVYKLSGRYEDYKEFWDDEWHDPKPVDMKNHAIPEGPFEFDQK